MSKEPGKIRIVLFGEGGVGKSALTIRYFQRTFIPDYDPTIEDSYTKWITVGSDRLFLEVTDTAGQEAFIAIRDHYIQNGDGFLLVYSVTDQASLTNIHNIRDHIYRIKNSKDVPIIVVANKIDLSSDRVVDTEKGLEFAETLNQEAKKSEKRYIETSAKTGQSVDECFQTLVRITHRSMNPNPNSDPKPCICC